MIIVELQGGLGNQMFQYAAARSLALRRGTKLAIDTGWYDKAQQTDGVDKRVYELEPFALRANIYRHTIINRLQSKVLGIGFYTDETDPYTFHSEVFDLPANTRLFGFFQNEKYFLDIRQQLLTDFTLRQPASGVNAKLLKEIIKDPNSIAVHVRRGDYAHSKSHNAFHGLKDVDYYKQSIQIISKKIPDPSLYVFSDDPGWCKENLKLGAKTVYVDNNTYGGEDMRLMRACRHNIIANSSFSWWGAWLNDNPDKIVVAPKRWLNQGKFDTSDLIPKSWVQI